MKENSFQLAQLKPQLKPFRLYFYTRLRSTNDHAANLRRRRKLYAPAIVLTTHQMKGRGRGGNSWWSGTGSLTVTFCIPTDEKIPPHQVPLITGLAVHEALAELLLESHGDTLQSKARRQSADALRPNIEALRIKWPNDLWHDDLKIGGLLCERIENVDLLGLGLNVNVRRTDIPTSLRHRVTSLQAIAGQPFALSEVLASIARRIDRLLLKREYGSFGAVVQQINRVHALTGRRVRVTQPGESPVEGLCEGLDADGRLLLRDFPDAHGRHRVIAGHVELLS